MIKIPNACDILEQAWDEHNNLTAIFSDKLDIRGGQFDAGKLPDFLDAWEPCCERFTWRLWELLHRVDLEHGAGALKPAKGNVPADLERARLFGKDGDLLIRRDRQTFFWRFIGSQLEGDALWPSPEGEFGEQNFKEMHNSKEFKQRVVYHYLWRIGDKRVTTHWLEGKDDLLNLGGKDGTNEKQKDNYLKQIHYLRDGAVEFVRFIDILTKEKRDQEIETKGVNHA